MSPLSSGRWGYQDSGRHPLTLRDTALQRGMDLGILTAGEYKMLMEEPFLRATGGLSFLLCAGAYLQGPCGDLADAVDHQRRLDAADVGGGSGGIDVTPHLIYRRA